MSALPVPEPPSIIPASPTTDSEVDAVTYFPPTTRSATKRKTSDPKTASDQHEDVDADRRARSRERSPQPTAIRRRGTGLASKSKTDSTVATPVQKSEPLVPNGLPNGFLSPASAAQTAQYYWREISRSPSPLGLIPIHVSWRSFIHRHEVPRKLLHVSIGFVTCLLWEGHERSDIYPWLMYAAIPITLVELVRHQSAWFNRIYVKVMGALMRETEVHDKYNGVIFYLIGAWSVLRFFPDDIAVVSILLLSWCDTAASTFGRLYGRYTPRVRRGKSLAGSIAAMITGFSACLMFYRYFVPSHGGVRPAFAYKGHLSMPAKLVDYIDRSRGTEYEIGGWPADILFSIITGLIASFSEAIDVFGIDDNLTIPVFSAIGIWAFLQIFG